MGVHKLAPCARRDGYNLARAATVYGKAARRGSHVLYGLHSPLAGSGLVAYGEPSVSKFNEKPFNASGERSTTNGSKFKGKKAFNDSEKGIQRKHIQKKEKKHSMKSH